MTSNKKTKGWLREHRKDPYVKRAQGEGYRSRAVYKLAEIDKRDRLFRPGITVVDLGAAPGSWSQYARRRVGAHGQVIALDVLPMEPLADVGCLQGDFSEPEVLDLLLMRLKGRPVDLVISDMAPNLCGIAPSDQARAMSLAELALDFAQKTLSPEGSCLLKAFQGAGYEELRRTMQKSFEKVVTRKPKASRTNSREIYLLGKGLRVVSPPRS
jgi:23S rRNA (uridine2552-2'-O)-methyltransferase